MKTLIDTLKTHIQNRDTENLLTFIANDPEVLNLIDENGASGLLLIAYSGLAGAIEKAKELKKELGFHEAIVYGDVDRVKVFLKRDVSIVNVYSGDGFTPLSLAAFFNRDEIANLLLENGADPNLHAINPSKVNALHSAIARSNLALCKLFIAGGANVNATQTQNITPLHSAAHLGNLDLVKLLVQNGAQIDFRMDAGKSAIDFAEKDGHVEVKLYLENQLKNSHP